MLILDDFFTTHASQISFALLLAASVTFIVIALVFKTNRRRMRLRAFASKNGIDYRRTAPHYVRHLAEMPLAKNNEPYEMRNFLSGGLLDYAVCFDFFCRVPVTFERFCCSVVCFHASYDLPDFFIMPKEAPYRVPAAAGRVVLGPEFEAQYCLYSTNPAKARALFSCGGEKFFCNEKGWSLEFKGDKALVYRSGVLYSPFVLADFINKAFEVYMAVLGEPAPQAGVINPADSARAERR